jgi:hypothetical protein
VYGTPNVYSCFGARGPDAVAGSRSMLKEPGSGSAGSARANPAVTTAMISVPITQTPMSAATRSTA